MRILGHDLRYANHNDALFLVHEIFVSCAYDFACDNPAPLIIDGGANMGAATLFFLSRYPRARVIAVEANPGAFKLLEANTADLGTRIVRYGAALTETGETTQLYRPDGDLASLLTTIDPALGGRPADVVPAMRLSALLSGVAGQVDFVKLDIEGAEYGVLRECSDAGVLERVRAMTLEYHITASEPNGLQMLREILTAAGFDTVTAEPGRPGLGFIRAARTSD